MPRMKNAGKTSKSLSPYKKVSTLHTFGFTSPKQKAKTGTGTRQQDDTNSKEKSTKASETPIDPKRRGRPSTVHHDVSSEHKASSTETHEQDNSDTNSLKIKREKLELQSEDIGPTPSRGHGGLNGNLESLSAASKHLHKDGASGKNINKPDQSRKQNPPPAKVTHSHNLTASDAEDVSNPLPTNQKPVFSPPSHSRSSRIITPSKRILEDIAGKGDKLSGNKTRKLEQQQSPEKLQLKVGDSSTPVGAAAKTGGSTPVGTAAKTVSSTPVGTAAKTGSSTPVGTAAKTDGSTPVGTAAKTSSGTPVRMATKTCGSKLSMDQSASEPSETSDSEGRFRRSRKPSQKLIELLESEKEPDLAEMEVVTPRSVPSFVQSSARSVSDMTHDDERNSCRCCGFTKPPFVAKFKCFYCQQCHYMYTKYLIRNLLPDCTEGCDHSSLHQCHGCRAIAMNASLPPEKRIGLREKDRRRKYLQAAIDLREGHFTHSDANDNSLSVANVHPKQHTVPSLCSQTTPAPASTTLISPAAITLTSPAAITLTEEPLSQRHQLSVTPSTSTALNSPVVTTPLSLNSSSPGAAIPGLFIDLSSPSVSSPAATVYHTPVKPLQASYSHKPIARGRTVTILKSPVKRADTPSKWASELRQAIHIAPATGAIVTAPINRPGAPRMALPAKQLILKSFASQPRRTLAQLPTKTMSISNLLSTQGLLNLPNANSPAKPMVYSIKSSTPIFTNQGGIKVIQHQIRSIPTTIKPPASTIVTVKDNQLVYTASKSTVSPPVLPTVVDVTPRPAQPIAPQPPQSSTPPPPRQPPVEQQPKPISLEPETSGPRVKHVSRSAKMAQGEPAMVHPANLRLSALPPDEKCKIWNETSKVVDDFSDEEIEQSKAARIDYNWDDNDVSSGAEEWMPTPKYSPKMKIKTKFVSSASKSKGGTGARRPRCGNCSGCHAVNCEVCTYCKDMKKYGGPGKMKQCCLERRCIYKEGAHKAVPRRSDSPSSFVGASCGKKRHGRPPKRYQADSASSIGDESIGTQDSLATQETADFVIDANDILVGTDLTNKPLSELLRASNRLKQSEIMPPPVTTIEADVEPTPEQSLTTADGTVITDQNPGFSLIEAFHRLMADFIDTYDIDKVWEQGVAVVTSAPQSIRVLCYLCGSGGCHQLTYCSVCCEPFHDFCLEEGDRPKSADSKDWLCRNCRFCQVCGKLDDLLTCDRCYKTYHGECLGDGYRIEPTSAGVWVCNSCVKCTSCGATTPGGPDDRWNSDFSLCASCEALKLKGNFCPICGLCYSDDDWETKMIGCSTCESWTHAKCENLPDDLYQLSGFVDDNEAQYVCRKCLTLADKPIPAKSEWLEALEKLRVKGFTIICTSMLDKKYAQSVAKVDENELKTFYDQHKDDLLAKQEKRSHSMLSPKSGSPLSKAPIRKEQSEQSANHVLKSEPQCSMELKIQPIVITAKSTEPKDLPVTSTDNDTEPRTQSVTSIGIFTEPKNKLATVTDNDLEAKDQPVARKKRGRKPKARPVVSTEPSAEPKAESTAGIKKGGRHKHKHKKDKKEKKEKKKPTHGRDCSDGAEAGAARRTTRASADLASADEAPPAKRGRPACKKKRDAESTTNRKGKGKGRGRPPVVKRVSSRPPVASPGKETPSRKSSRHLQSPTHSTPVEKKRKGSSAAKNATLNTPSADTPDLTPRRSGREKKRKVPSDEEVPPLKEVRHPVNSNVIEDGSLHNISSSSLPEDFVYNVDPVELSIRFKDVEWERPTVTYQSLKESGHPLDICEIQKRVKQYTSVNDFVDDVVRVLQGAITRGQYEGNKALKRVHAVKKLFIQEVKQLFPWCEIHKSGLWEYNLSMPIGMLEQARLPPSSEHTYALWLQKPEQQSTSIVQPSPYKLAICTQPDVPSERAVVPLNLKTEEDPQGSQLGTSLSQGSQLGTSLSILPTTITTDIEAVLDSRRCQLCSRVGDDPPDDSGRLIYCGADDWVHVNCALWSAEVFEEVDGTLQRVHATIARGKMLNCSLCGNRGATVGCCATNCSFNYHFMCARSAGCIFMEDQQVFCANCPDAAIGKVVQGHKFAIMRTVTVDFAHAKIKKPWQKGFRPPEVTVIAGSLTVENLGYVTPESDYLNLLVPIDFCITRIYWSTKTPFQRCVYTCRVVKLDTRLDTEIETIPDVTICHDPDISSEYTAPELLSTRYPSVFHPDKFGLLQNAATTDYDEQLMTVSNDYSELANLTGIASALNKAAHRSQRKRRRKERKKAAILYGSSAPELSGNIDDDVAEILDMVTEEDEEILDEREVVILRDVDDHIAQEVVEVIGKMSKEEADELGGVQAVMQSILNKHKPERDKTSINSNSAGASSGVSLNANDRLAVVDDDSKRDKTDVMEMTDELQADQAASEQDQMEVTETANESQSDQTANEPQSDQTASRQATIEAMETSCQSLSDQTALQQVKGDVIETASESQPDQAINSPVSTSNSTINMNYGYKTDNCATNIRLSGDTELFAHTTTSVNTESSAPTATTSVNTELSALTTTTSIDTESSAPMATASVDGGLSVPVATTSVDTELSAPIATTSIDREERGSASEELTESLEVTPVTAGLRTPTNVVSLVRTATDSSVSSLAAVQDSTEPGPVVESVKKTSRNVLERVPCLDIPVKRTIVRQPKECDDMPVHVQVANHSPSSLTGFESGTKCVTPLKKEDALTSVGNEISSAADGDVDAVTDSHRVSSDELNAAMPDTDVVDSRPHSTLTVASSISSLQAYSSASSGDNSPIGTDMEDSLEPTDPPASSKLLLSPPKIVITDFSFEEPTDIVDVDPFHGVEQASSAVVSHGTKDRLKFLVKKRSESLGETGSADSVAEEPISRRVGAADSLQIRQQRTSTLTVDSIPVVHASREPPRPMAGKGRGSEGSPGRTIEANTSSTTADSLQRSTSKSANAVPAVPSQSLFIDSAICTSRTRKESPQSKPADRPLPKLPDISIQTESASDPEEVIVPFPSIHTPSPPQSPKLKRISALLPGKVIFTNNFYDGGDDFNCSSDYIVTRDRSPVTSASEESDSDSDEEALGRIIVPPSVNCVVRDSRVTERLSCILNAKVVVEKLLADSDSEYEPDQELFPIVEVQTPVMAPTPPPRDISRDVRKDMINYCEESAESSSTDEEDLCKPRLSLRRRGNSINYNENALASSEKADGNTEEKPRRKHHHKPRPMTGKVVLNKDGSIKSRTENIPSELQKTISDAIRKARSKEAPPSSGSANQAYAGAGQGGNYSVVNARRYEPDVMAKRTLSVDETVNMDRLKADNQQVAMMSSSTRSSVLPEAATEEEITMGQRVKDDTRPANRNKPSSTFLTFEISSDDGFKTRADNWNDAWRNVTDAVRDLRISSGCPAISFAGVDGLHMFGLSHTSIAYFTEQLYGARYCHSYRFKFHKPPLFEYDEELMETATGSSRSESFTGRKLTEMFSFIDSRYRKRPVGLPGIVSCEKDDSELQSSRRATSLELPMAMRFRHVKTNARRAVAVYRSLIHGRGLFCKRVIDSGEMIIEYAGEVIRQGLCDKREKYYDSRSIGCYMFRIDDHLVVDATMKGNAARFINHSCDPNCFSKVIDVAGTKHIVIFALRTIQRGEELTYDYKFPFEEVKIPCACGAKKCRGYLN